MSQLLTTRREFFFAYDIRMGNPNGDPDENRPRVLPDGTHYVTDVRLKRFVRDFLKSQGEGILVDVIEGKTTNLTGRVAHHLAVKGVEKANAEEAVDILLGDFIDARLFGSALAFKKKQKQDKVVKAEAHVEGKVVSLEWEQPKTLTGAVQINHGEVLHQAEPVDIHGTSVFGSQEGRTQGTFTTYFGLRYALIGFNGIANEHSAKLSRMTDEDYDTLLAALWKSVRSAGNTRTKVGQVPRLLISIEYEPGAEFQFGNLLDYVLLTAADGKEEKAWAGPVDYVVDLGLLRERLGGFAGKIKAVSYELSPDIGFAKDGAPEPGWERLDLDA